MKKICKNCKNLVIKHDKMLECGLRKILVWSTYSCPCWEKKDGEIKEIEEDYETNLI